MSGIPAFRVSGRGLVARGDPAPLPELQAHHTSISRRRHSVKCHVFDYYNVMVFYMTLHHLSRTFRVDSSGIIAMRPAMVNYVQDSLHIILLISHRREFSIDAPRNVAVIL